MADGGESSEMEDQFVRGRIPSQEDADRAVLLRTIEQILFGETIERRELRDPRSAQAVPVFPSA
ncbi:MAG TPA: hypothetical protein VHN14_01100 [Kofleriaceae bacterium]|nr:hypothetical protein [Kofleriaceae bacterium]